MKQQTFTFLILIISIAFISCSSSRSIGNNQTRIQGAWKLIQENGNPVERTQIKYYTEKEFSWFVTDNNGIIFSGAAGGYRLIDGVLYEDIDMTMLINRTFKGRTAKIKIEIEKDTMVQNILIQMQNMENRFTEKWVRIK